MSNYIVAKSAVTLSGECEKLRAQMVESNQKLKDLIENNKILKKSLGVLDYS
jgi:DNA-binding transcriptional regulator LsrR (DeoR family)